MVTHKFVEGDHVMVRPTTANPNVRPGKYKITRALPINGTGCQYRAKNLLDEHERVFNESELAKA